MNKERRKAIEAMAAKIEELKSQLEGLDVSDLRDEEQDYFDNMPESLQGGDKGQAAEAAAEALTEAIDSLQEAVDALDSAVNSMQRAAE